MKHSYVVFPDETEVTYSDMDRKGNVRIRIETPTDGGFKCYGCVLPSYEVVESVGYSEPELKKLEEFLYNNAHLILEYAAAGGFENAAAV